MLETIISKLQNTFCRGKVTLCDESNRLQVQQNELYAGQVRSDIYAPQQYGVQTYPHVGADTVCLFKGGSIENGYVITSFDPKYKPADIQEGDVEMYTSRNYSAINSKTKATGTIEFTGTEDTTIPVGSLATRPSDGFQYITTEIGHILGGKAWVRAMAYGIGGTPATGNAHFDGIPTLPIYKGMVVYKGEIGYVVSSDGVIPPTGGVDLPVIALTTGEEGNAEEGVGLTLAVEVPLLTIEVGSGGFVGGTGSDGSGDIGNLKQDTALDVFPLIPLIDPTATINNMSIAKQRIWIKQEEGRILIEAPDQDVQIISKTAEVNTIGDATVTAGGDASVRAVDNVNVKADNVNVITNTADIDIAVTATVDCPLTTWTGNIIHIGNMTQTGLYTLIGDVTQTGKITSTGDHLSATISLQGHVHAGDGGTGSGADTGPPL